MKMLKKFTLPNISILVVVLACFSLDWHFKNWEEHDRVIEHDIHCYYAYLPSLFIFNDIKQEKSDYRIGDDYYLFWPNFTSDGKKVNKMTMGLSVLYAPFFFTAHLYAICSEYLPWQPGYEANGFSEPYKVFLLLSAIFYLIIGLEFLRRILKYFLFSEWVISVTILLVGLGTNLLCYSSLSAPNVHVYNFFLFSVFVFYTLKWYDNSSLKNSLVLGLVFGFISLVRPSNAVVLIFFLLYGISSLPDLKMRILFFLEKVKLLLVIFTASLVAWVPQLIYWKIVTGSFLFYSYSEEGFLFTEPKILEGLFSFRKGWLLYTPMMGFALVGIFMLKDKFKKVKWAILTFLGVNIYIIFSWWCWWYGGSFGQRSMIESYVILAIPLAYVVKFMDERKVVVRICFYLLFSFFILLNMFQTLQFELHSLHWDGMTKELYFKQFGILPRIDSFDSYVQSPDAWNLPKSGSEVARVNINLKAFNGKFLCADAGFYDLVIANRDNAWEWETFFMIEYKNRQCSIRSFRGRYLSPELKKNSEISATHMNMDKWERFTIIDHGNNLVSFKAVNEKYLSVDEKTLQLFAVADEIGEREKFEIVYLK